MMLCVTKTSYHIVGVRKLTEPRAAAFLHLLESLLIMEQWMKQDTFEVKSLPAIKRHLRRVMQLFSSVVDRQEGNGDCTVKFHLPMHLINDIKKYRAPANWDEGIGEHNHIANAKGPAELTQHQPGNFEYQTPVRDTENLAHGCAVDEYKAKYEQGRNLEHFGGEVFRDESNTSTNLWHDDGNHKDVMPSTHWKGQGSTLLVNATDCVWLVWNETTPVSAAIRNSRQICYVQSVIVPLVHLQALDSQHPSVGWLLVKTKVKHIGGTIVRAHPSFTDTGPCHDRMNIDWMGVQDPIPAHVRVLIVVRRWKRGPNYQRNGLELRSTRRKCNAAVSTPLLSRCCIPSLAS